MKTLRSNEEWLAIIQECRASGLSDKEWCRQHGISNSSFYYNLRKLRKLACDIPSSEGTPSVPAMQEVVPLVVADEPVTNLVPPVQRNDSDTGEPLFLRIECGGIAVTCPEGLAPSTLCSVIQALRMGC